MTQLPLLQSRIHARLQAAALLVSRGDFVVWPFESSRALRLLRLHQQMLLPNFLYQTSYSADFKDARWREAAIDDKLLSKSIMIHQGTEDIKYIATYLEAVTDQGTFQVCLTEATSSLLRWMDLKGSKMSMIKSLMPSFIKEGSG
jgi:hypothetical protein